MNALDIAEGLVSRFEGCRLKAYPDPATGGDPWTCGFGETEGVTKDTVWTLEEARVRLKRRLAYFMAGVIKACPQLAYEPPERIAACVSLAYNIGLRAFRGSSVCSLTKRKEYQAAANAFLRWNRAAGRVMRGLTIRRQLERKTYLEC